MKPFFLPPYFFLLHPPSWRKLIPFALLLTSSITAGRYPGVWGFSSHPRVIRSEYSLQWFGSLTICIDIHLNNFFHCKWLQWAYCQVNNINREEFSWRNITAKHHLVNVYVGNEWTCRTSWKWLKGTEFYMPECARVCCVYCDSDGWIDNDIYGEVCFVGIKRCYWNRFPSWLFDISKMCLAVGPN